MTFNILRKQTSENKEISHFPNYCPVCVQNQENHLLQDEQQIQSFVVKAIDTDVQEIKEGSFQSVNKSNNEAAPVQQVVESLNQFSPVEMMQADQDVFNGNLENTQQHASIFQSMQNSQIVPHAGEIGGASVQSTPSGNSRQRRKWELPNAISSPVSAPQAVSFENWEGNSGVPMYIPVPSTPEGYGNPGNSQNKQNMLWTNACPTQRVPSLVAQGNCPSIDHGSLLPKCSSEQMKIQDNMSNCHQEMDFTGYNHNSANALHMGSYIPMPTFPPGCIQGFQPSLLVSAHQHRNTAASEPGLFQPTAEAFPKPVCNPSLEVSKATEQINAFNHFRSSLRHCGQRPQTAQSILRAAGSGTRAVRERLRSAIERESAIRMEAEMNALDVEDLKLQNEVSRVAAEEEVSAQEELWNELQVIQDLISGH